MAHSYDQTLIQRMGFADPDRRSPAHDDACIQIATEPERFVRAVKELRFLRNGKCDLEVPLQKGEGKYASTVGFIDAMVTWETAKEDYSINKPRHYCSMGYGSDRCSNDIKQSDEKIEKIIAGNYPHEDSSKWVKQLDDGWQSVDSYAREIDSFNKKLEFNREHRATYGNVPCVNDTDPRPPKRIVARTNGRLRNEQYLLKSIIEGKQHVECEGPIPVAGPASSWHRGHYVLVEVKTNISNIGDLLRQMNLYREYKQYHNGTAISDYVIWSLDPVDFKFAKLLAQQGYILIAGPLP